MILYLILQGFNAIISFVISLFPTLGVPDFISNSLPTIIHTIAGFNYYLPINEAITCVLFVLGFSVVYRVFSFVGGLVHLNI